MFDVSAQLSSWLHVPFEAEGIGYFSSTEALKWSDDYLRSIIAEAEHTRYGLDNWRNTDNLWRSTLGHDTTHNKSILDYGCGNGIEALQFARSGNQVTLADIIPDNIRLAQRVLALHGLSAVGEIPLTVEPPFFETDKKFDIILSNGVLHHTPYFRDVLFKLKDYLNPSGEIRLMLYSDKSWTIYCHPILPGIQESVMDSPYYTQYVRVMDYVGHYADWFTREKIELKVGDFLTIERLDYITVDGRYLTCTLKPK